MSADYDRLFHSPDAAQLPDEDDGDRRPRPGASGTPDPCRRTRHMPKRRRARCPSLRR